MKRLVLSLSLLFIVALLVGYLVFYGGSPEEHLETTGVVELKEVELAPQRGGRIVWLCCEEGDRIEKGQLALRLEDAKLRARLKEVEARTEELRSTIGAAQKELRSISSIVASLEASLKGLDEEIERTRALLKEAQRELARVKALYEEGVATEKELDRATTQVEVLQRDVAIAERKKERLLSEKKAKHWELEAQRLRINSLKAGLKKLEAQKELIGAELKELKVLSPVDGVVVYRAFEVGEVVAPAQAVYTVHSRSHIWVRVDIAETLIDRIGLGNRATLWLPSAPEKRFTAVVTEISPLAGFATQRDAKRGRPDIKTFRVKLSIKEGNKELLKHGMTVRVRMY